MGCPCMTYACVSTLQLQSGCRDTLSCCEGISACVDLAARLLSQFSITPYSLLIQCITLCTWTLSNANGSSPLSQHHCAGIVLAKEGGALGKMMPVFNLFAGGPLGSGRQWCSWIHRCLGCPPCTQSYHIYCTVMADGPDKEPWHSILESCHWGWRGGPTSTQQVSMKGSGIKLLTHECDVQG